MCFSESCALLLLLLLPLLPLLLRLRLLRACASSGAIAAPPPAFCSPAPLSLLPQFALIRRTTLGRLTSPIREPSILDRWSPYEIALFESGICMYGKQFPTLASLVGSKNAKECIEFYYAWKKSKNYAQWKATWKGVGGWGGS